MDRRLLSFILLLLVVGLLGITAIQIFWLKNSLQTREISFDQAVYDSLDEIALLIQDLEYQPIIDEMMQEMVLDPYFPNMENEQLDEEGMQQMAERIRESQADLRRIMLREMLAMRPFAEVIDTSRLHEVIGQVLSTKGIRTPYYYGITEYATNNFVIISPGADLRELYRTPYIVKIYSRTFIDANRFLLIDFPDRDAYLFKAYWLLIASSVFFVILLILSFALAIHIIFRQKRLSDMKTDFINNMTHELKTPIATISLASEMLRDNTIGSAENSRRKYANIIQEENKRLADHVEKVLQIARLEKGEIELSIEETDIHELLKGILDAFSLQVESRGGVLRSALEASEPVVNIDRMHMKNVINNLLDNALKYNDKVPEIAVKTSDADGGVMVEVSDNGIGMTREEQKRIFEKFYRVSTGNLHDVKGFGLGLSYVKSIVDKHGGKIFVNSKLKYGSTFKIFIPINPMI